MHRGLSTGGYNPRDQGWVLPGLADNDLQGGRINDHIG